MKTAMSTTGPLMGLVTRFAAELETLNERSIKNKQNVSAKVDADLKDGLLLGQQATGKTESALIEACIRHSLQYVISELIREMEEARRKFYAADPVTPPASNLKRVIDLSKESRRADAPRQPSPKKTK